MTDASPDWDELRRKAEAATPTEGATLNRYEHGGGRLFIDRTQEGGGRQLIADFYGEGADREFYAAANPATILAILDQRAALLDRAEKAEAEAKALREALDAIKSLGRVDMRGCWEHELRDIIGSMTDGAERALTGGDHG